MTLVSRGRPLYPPPLPTPHPIPTFPFTGKTSTQRMGADSHMLWERRCVTDSLRSTDLAHATWAAFTLKLTGFLGVITSSAEIFA